MGDPIQLLKRCECPGYHVTMIIFNIVAALLYVLDYTNDSLRKRHKWTSGHHSNPMILIKYLHQLYLIMLQEKALGKFPSLGHRTTSLLASAQIVLRHLAQPGAFDTGQPKKLSIKYCRIIGFSHIVK